MTSLYLTPASISYLNQFLLALVITIYLGVRFLAFKHPRPSGQDWLLVVFFISVTIFSFTLFLDVSLLPAERLPVVYLENTVLGLLLIALLQFAYRFPTAKENQRFERWLFFFLSCAYAGWEAGVAIWRFQLLAQGLVEFRPDYMDYPPIFEFLWVVFVFARGARQNWGRPASRRFALIFVIPFLLAIINLLRSYDLVSTPFYHISLSVGILVTLLIFALNYLGSKTETTSLMAKFSGAILTSVLAVLGVIAWLVAPAYATQYTPTILDHRTLHFAPNSQGGYEIFEGPIVFENELGQNLGLTDSNIKHPSATVTGFEFPFYGQRYQNIFISNDGVLSFGEALDYKDLENNFSRLPVILALALDLDPETSPNGGVFLRQEAENLVITYSRLKAFSHPENEYTFQVVLHTNGSFELTYHGLPLNQQYYIDDRPAAAAWASGIKPAGTAFQRINSFRLPLQSGPEGIIQDEYRSFREYLHNFIFPLAEAVLASSLLFLVGLPLVLSFGVTRPLNSLLKSVEQINHGQLALQVPVQHNDEIGFLTQSFNDLSTELNNLIKNLESRVDDRTTDLLKANEQLRKLSSAVEQNPSAILIADKNARIEYVNPAFTRSTGYTFEEAQGQNPQSLRSNLTPPETYQEMWKTLLAGETWRGELANCRKNGEIYWEYIVIAPIRNELDTITHYVSIQEDITDRKLVEQSLQESERQYRELFEMESDAIFIYRNVDGAILEANSAASALYGFSHAELITKRHTDLAAEPQAIHEALTSRVSTDNLISIPLSWHRKKDGTIFPVETTARFITWKGESVHVAAIRDITERQRFEKELERLATIDSLTNLFNRRHFFIEAERIFARSNVPPYELTVLMLDVDHFKKVNDTYGHQQGDIVLREIARRLRENLRPTDLLGRYGGEEFVALLIRTPGKEVGQIAERLVESIRELPVEDNGVCVSVTISLGAAALDGKVSSLDELISHADQALYTAKQMGRNRWATWERNLQPAKP